VLVAVGGIETADDAWDRVKAGATLVQAYTGFIYGGPLWPRKLQRELAMRAKAAGFATVEQAVGTDAKVTGDGNSENRSDRSPGASTARA
jgi:dihydroorotate dehydrogenase